MSKILVFIYDGMADFQISFLMHILGADCGKELVVIANNSNIVKSKSGILYKPHKGLHEIINEEVEGLIIPGGWLMNLKDELLDIIRKLHSENKFIAAICGAPWILAKAGVLSSSKYTTTIEEWKEEHFKLLGIEDPFPRDGYIDTRVVRDGNIITAKGMAFIDFTIEVLDYLRLFKDKAEKKDFENELKGY